MGGSSPVVRPSGRPDDLDAVTAVADATTSLMALLYGAFLGALSSLLVVALVVRVSPDIAADPVARSLVGLGAWIASWMLVSIRAVQISAVFQRGLLLGAVEWTALILWGRVDVAAALANSAESTGTGVDSDALTGGVAVTMLWLCLLGWAVCRWARRPYTAVLDPPDAPAGGQK